jgi:fatty acid desaturase
MLLSTARVRELSKLRPSVVVRDTLLCWAAILAAWTIVVLWPRWWTVLLAIPVIGSRYYALLIIGHDGIHRRLFRSPVWNDWFADLFVFGPVAAITRINNQNHLGHHRRLSTPDDPDLHQFTCTNKFQWRLFLAYLSGLTSLRRSFENVFIRGPKARQSESAGLAAAPQRYTLRDFLLVGAWQVALIGGLSWFVGWWAYPVLWLVPLYTFAFVPDNLRAFAEHSHPEPDARADTHRLISYVSDPLERWFVSPFNMNYHAAHHLWPSIPYYNLPQADREIRSLPAAAELEWRGTYCSYVLKYFRLLPLEECEESRSAS